MKTKIIIPLLLSTLLLTSCKEEPIVSAPTVYEYKCFSVFMMDEKVIKPDSYLLKGGWEIFSIQVDKVPDFDFQTGLTGRARCFMVVRRPVE